MFFCFGSDDKKGRFCLVVIEEIENAGSILGIGAVIKSEPDGFLFCRKSSDDRAEEGVIRKKGWNKKKNPRKDKEPQTKSDLMGKNQGKEEKSKEDPVKEDPVARGRG